MIQVQVIIPQMTQSICITLGNVRVSDGNSFSVKWYGDIDLRIVNYGGSVTYLTLKDVSFVPIFWKSLFSVTLELEKGM